MAQSWWPVVSKNTQRPRSTARRGGESSGAAAGDRSQASDVVDRVASAPDAIAAWSRVSLSASTGMGQCDVQQAPDRWHRYVD
jgi:hypothetical protein